MSESWRSELHQDSGLVSTGLDSIIGTPACSKALPCAPSFTSRCGCRAGFCPRNWGSMVCNCVVHLQKPKKRGPFHKDSSLPNTLYYFSGDMLVFRGVTPKIRDPVSLLSAKSSRQEFTHYFSNDLIVSHVFQ